MNFSFVPNQGLMVDGRYITEFDVKVNRIFYYIEEDESKKNRMEYELVAKMFDGTELPPRRVKKLNNLSYFTLWTEIMDAGLDRWERQMLLLRLQTSCEDAKQVKMYHITSNGYQTLEVGKEIFVAGDYTYMSNQDGIQLEVDENVKQMKWKNKVRLADKKNADRKEEDYLMASPGASEILFTAVLLSAIKFVFIKAGFNPAVCINLYGKTGSYKTALTQAMMYMENPSQFMCSLVNDQKKMAVKKVQQCYGFPMILEDYHPAATGYDYKRQISMMDAVVRHIESKRLDSSEWILSEEPNPELQIISPDDWNLVQIKRKQRGMKYRTAPQNKGVKVIARNEGMLPLIDVIYCGYCGCKCTNGSKYNYWTIKDTGERRASRQAIYKCQDAWQGVPHYKVYQFKAEKIEKIVFQAIAEYIDKLQENEDIFEQISENGRKAKKEKAKELSREQERLKHIQQKISVMEDKIPEAMLGEYPVPVDKLVDLIEKQRQEKEQQEKVIAEKQKELDGADVSFNEWDSLRMQIPTWKDVFLNADNPTKRVLVNKLIEKISVKEDEVVIRFKININEIRSKALKKSGSMVPENKLEDKSVILDSLKIYPNPE